MVNEKKINTNGAELKQIILKNKIINTKLKHMLGSNSCSATSG